MERLTRAERWARPLERIRDTFDGSTSGQVTAYLASVAQRSLPNYRAFCVDTQSGDPEFVGWVVATVWRQVVNRTLDYGTLANLSRRVQPLVPEDGTFASAYTELARYALSAIDLALRSLSRSNVDDVATASVLSLESTYRYLTVVTTRIVPHVPTRESQLEETAWILGSPMLAFEIQRLERDASVACERDVVTRELVEKLRSDEEYEGVAPFRRGLIKTPRADADARAATPPRAPRRRLW
jgi:uncharacterized protein YjaG (DUF416 family)